MTIPSMPPGLSRAHPAWWISTVLGVGCLPGAPGTWGSLAAVTLAFAFIDYFSIVYMVILALTIFALGCWAAGVYVRRLGREDPQQVVIDEVAGQMLALAAAPRGLAGFAVAFALFRAFDVLKPFPVGWCDRNVHGGLGVMLDDMAAGIYVFIIMIIGTNIVK